MTKNAKEFIVIILLCSASALIGEKIRGDDNAKPKFGDSGYPVNCRAYIQYAINEYRYGTYTADDTMAGIERNCGENGAAWKDKR